MIFRRVKRTIEMKSATSIGDHGLAVLWAALILALAVILSFGCAGGGSSTTSGLRIAGTVFNPDGSAYSGDIRETTFGNSTKIASDGSFEIESAVGADLVFVQGGSEISVPLDPERIPTDATRVSARFVVDTALAVGALVDVAVEERRPSSEPDTDGSDGEPEGAVPTATATYPSDEPMQSPTLDPDKSDSGGQTPSPGSSVVTPSSSPTPSPTATAAAIPTATHTPDPSPPPTPGGEECFGDVNCDGERDTYDIDCFNQVVDTQLGGPPRCPSSTSCDSAHLADFNQDGVVDEADQGLFVDFLHQPCPEVPPY